jgi:hypothetical protein
MMPMKVNRPMIPKMNAPIRMRIGQGMSGVSNSKPDCAVSLGVDAGVTTSAAATALPVS